MSKRTKINNVSQELTYKCEVHGDIDIGIVHVSIGDERILEACAQCFANFIRENIGQAVKVRRGSNQ